MTSAHFLDKLNSLDFSHVAQKLMSNEHGVGWDLQQTITAIRRYKMFLYVHSLFPKNELVPTQEIDIVWHAHILCDTAKYMDDCLYLYGYILHHQANNPLIEENTQLEENAFAVTQSLFQEVFGTDVMEKGNIIAAPCLHIPNDSSYLQQQARCIILPKLHFDLSIHC